MRGSMHDDISPGVVVISAYVVLDTIIHIMYCYEGGDDFLELYNTYGIDIHQRLDFDNQ